MPRPGSPLAVPLASTVAAHPLIALMIINGTLPPLYVNAHQSAEPQQHFQIALSLTPAIRGRCRLCEYGVDAFLSSLSTSSSLLKLRSVKMFHMKMKSALNGIRETDTAPTSVSRRGTEEGSRGWPSVSAGTEWSWS